MLNRISHTFLHVLDRDEALDVYVGKLGVVKTDADLGNMRWLTVGFPRPARRRARAHEPRSARVRRRDREQICELVAKGGGSGLILHTDDCRGTYEALRAQGVEFTQEPVERFYSIDCGLRDPFGNPLRFTQPPEGPIVVPSPEELQAQRA